MTDLSEPIFVQFLINRSSTMTPFKSDSTSDSNFYNYGLSRTPLVFFLPISGHFAHAREQTFLFLFFLCKILFNKNYNTKGRIQMLILKPKNSLIYSLRIHGAFLKPNIFFKKNKTKKNHWTLSYVKCLVLLSALSTTSLYKML